MSTVDSLDIQISAQAKNAEKALNSLSDKLNALSASLKGINGSGLIGLANGVSKLATSMQGMNNVKTTDFTRLATNIEKLATLNTQGLNSSASSLSHLTRAFNTLGGVSENAQQVGVLASNLSKLGSASMQRAITNIPQLATAMNDLMTTLSQAPAVSDNVIQMTNALSNLASQGSRVRTATNTLVSGLNRTNKASIRTTKSVTSLASAFGRFYANFFLLVRGIKGLWNSIEGTADYIEAYNYFNVALGKIGSDWSYQYEQYGYDSAETYAESFATRLQQKLSGLSGITISINEEGGGLLTESGLQNLGLNIKEVTQYASQLASVTNSVGQTGEVSLTAASAFTKLGADMSSLFNIDYSTAMNKIQSGLIGQSRALYSMGIDITNATLQTYAYELGLEKAVSEMTQAEKMQLRMLAILDQSKVSWGDLANTINSPSNMIRQFTNNLEEAGMVLGQLFIPLLQKVLPVINGATIAIKRLLGSIASLLGIEIDLDSFGQGYSDLEEDVEDLSDGLDDVAKSAKKAYTSLLGFDKLNVISTPDTSTSTTTASEISTIDLTDEILMATEEYENAWAKAVAEMENKAQEFADKIQEIFKPITDPFNDLDWETITTNISELATALAPWGEEFGKGFIDFWGDMADIGADAIEEIFGENGVAQDLADWLNENDPERASKWGRAFGWLTLGLIGFSALIGISGIIVTLGKAFAFIFSPLSKLFGLITGSTAYLKVTTFFTNLGSTFMQMGGFVGILTADLGTVFASGSAMSIGLTIGTGIIAGILAAKAGFDVGKWLGKVLFPEDAKFYEEFKFFGEDGFFSTIKEDWGTTLIAMLDIYQSNPLFGGLISFLPEETKENTLNFFKELVEEFNNGGFSAVFEKIKKILIDFDTNLGDAITSLGNYFRGLIDNSIFGDIITGISEATNTYEDFKISIKNGFKEIFNTFPTPADQLKSIFDGMIDEALDFLEEISSIFTNVVESIINPFKEMEFSFDAFSRGSSIIGGVGLGVAGFASGGFPSEYSLFMAGENGIPELMGTVGGKTAVAGGTEITGIKEEIRNTANEEIALLRQQNILLQGILEKEFGISKDAVGKAAQSWARDYSKRTGRPAY